jgi:hypothetical protein
MQVVSNRIKAAANSNERNDFDYLAACRAAEQKALTRARRVKVRVAGLVALLGLSGADLVYREATAQEVTL